MILQTDVLTDERTGYNNIPAFFFKKRGDNNVYPCKPHFCYIRVRFKGSKLYRRVFVMALSKSGKTGYSWLTFRNCPHKEIFSALLATSRKESTVKGNMMPLTPLPPFEDRVYFENE